MSEYEKRLLREAKEVHDSYEPTEEWRLRATRVVIRIELFNFLKEKGVEPELPPEHGDK